MILENVLLGANSNNWVISHMKANNWVISHMKEHPFMRYSLTHLRGDQTFENTILSYGLEVMAWTCTHNLRMVSGPCAQ